MFRALRKNQLRKEKEQSLILPKSSARLEMVLCYPNRYSVGMANLGFQRVYQLFNNQEGIYCDRAFYPDPEEERYYFEKPLPIYSIETRKPLNQFDVIAFSFSFEMDYLRALRMLYLSGIPLRTIERRKASTKKNRFPLVIAGGIAISANPEPMADFLDLIVIGDAESVIGELGQKLIELAPVSGLKEIAEQFATLKSVYVPEHKKPEFGESTAKLLRALSSAQELPAYQIIFTPEMEFSEMGLIELARGCGSGCRFCLEGYFARPRREASYHNLIRAIEKIKIFRSRLGLIAPVITDLSYLDSLLEFMAREKISFSVSSLRLSGISEKLIAQLKESKNQTLTFAPEVGSSRLQRFINKELDEERILRKMKMVGKYQFPRIKLYYQVGFPEETELEVLEIASSVRRIRTALAMGAGRKNYPGVIEVSVNGFVPKPWTAFQWVAMAGQEELEKKFSILRSALKSEDGVEIKIQSSREALWQGILSRGDRDLGAVLEKMTLKMISVKEVLKMNELVKKYLRVRDISEILPWDNIAPGVMKKYLWREYERALAGKFSAGCYPGCRECGAC